MEESIVGKPFYHHPKSVSVREQCRCKAATMLIIMMVYQRVANTADAPLSGAPQGGGMNRNDSVKKFIILRNNNE